MIDKDLLVKALQNARNLNAEFDSSMAPAAERDNYRAALSDLIFGMFELPLLSELEELVRTTIRSDNYIKGAVERIEVTVLDHKRTRVQKLTGEFRDLLDGTAMQADSIYALSNQNDYSGVRIKLDAMENMYLRHALTRLETIRTLLKDM